MKERVKAAFADSFRILRLLVTEVLGAFFLALAILGGADTLRQYQSYSEDVQSGVWRVILALAFTLVTLGFGLQSFWRARRFRK